MARFAFLGDIKATLIEWSQLLRGLTFAENFRSFEWEGTIEAGAEKKITHRLKVIPTRFIVLSSGGVNTLIKGAGKPSSDFFYIKNMASEGSFTGKVLILP